MNSKTLLLSVTALGLLILSPTVRGQAIYTAGHGDLGVSYTPGNTTFTTHWGIDEGAVVDGLTLMAHTEYAPEGMIALTTSTTSVPGNVSAWLGVSGENPVYRLGSDTYPPNLGFNTSGAGTDGNWLDSTMSISLSTWSGPGDVALRSGSSSGSSTIFSTYSAASTIDDNTWAFDMGVGHVHLVWYFSEPGTYDLTFDWASTYIGPGADPGGTDVTGTGTFTIAVVPEPSAYALLGVAAVAWFGLKFRRP